MNASVDLYCEFSIPGSFVGKQGDLRGEHEIGEATHADFVLAVCLFWFILSCFLKFLFLFFKNITLPQQLLRRVLLPVDGYQIIIIRI